MAEPWHAPCFTGSLDEENEAATIAANRATRLFGRENRTPKRMRMTP